MDIYDFWLNFGSLLSAIALLVRDMLALRALSALSGLILVVCNLAGRSRMRSIGPYATMSKW
jgi:hypothetical protein